MNRSLLAAVLVATPGLALADPLTGQQAHESAKQAVQQMVDSASPRANPGNAHSAWREGERNQDSYSNIYATSGKVTVDGSKLSGELATRSTYWNSRDAKKALKRSFSWDWQAKRGRMVGEDKDEVAGLKV